MGRCVAEQARACGDDETVGNLNWHEWGTAPRVRGCSGPGCVAGALESVTTRAAALVYGTGIVGANVLSTWWLIDVPAVVVPAGALLAGVTLTVRDIVHDTLGAPLAILVVLAGTGLAWLVGSPRIATASAVAFAASELIDAATYSALRTRSRPLAVGASNVAGLVVDSAVFVPLAFGTTAMLAGQLIGKTVATIASLGVLAIWHRKPAG